MLPTRGGSEVQYWVLVQFMRDRLRIRDVRLYIRDLLKEYASLQKFKPKPTPLARCMDWERLLMEFEWPHFKEVSVQGSLRWSSVAMFQYVQCWLVADAQAAEGSLDVRALELAAANVASAGLISCSCHAPVIFPWRRRHCA
jgi:Glycosyl transferase family 90